MKICKFTGSRTHLPVWTDVEKITFIESLVTKDGRIGTALHFVGASVLHVKDDIESVHSAWTD